MLTVFTLLFCCMGCLLTVDDNVCVQELHREQIQVIVAPYEADAQLTYLVKNNLADFVITEDSDLLAFGCSKVHLQSSFAGFNRIEFYSWTGVFQDE